ncbi:alpha/beta hydrolase fold domain-containing protein [Halovulum dunhuangense]|uniref:Alpha/beta hydrolase fold domain-containing protein n=1 Tax=Halovulum dunhuangense TaxID=1505036 RepID=A0A849KUD1_9RHOB|nr:alpha/beta hydrolase fold domain-containing protein [Halovulum dunhuangense]NNU78888.1 alpha/beta hydrolase fold domain-containing protein [Halovulum dunhuangense]
MSRASFRLRVLRWMARRSLKRHLSRATSYRFERFRTELGARLFLRSPRGFRTRTLGGTPCRVRDGVRPGTLFLIHGGAFALFTARSHQGLAARLARPLGLSQVLPDYGRAPEHVFPHALDQVDAAYLAIAGQGPVVVAGDSAGGCLALSLLHRLHARGGPLPAAVLAFSPWADLGDGGPSRQDNAEADPMLPVQRLPWVASQYLGGADPMLPEVSPVHGRFPAACPVLIQVGRDEILRSDAEAVAAALEEAGAEVRLTLLPDALHGFQVLHGWLPEAEAAVEEACAFSARVLGLRA